MSKPIVALAGGVGAARFLDGLVRVIDPARLWIVGNTADDTEMHGLHISPDLDTVAYTLAGLANPQHGWGLAGDTFHCLEALRKLGAEAWFQLGDRDFAVSREAGGKSPGRLQHRQLDGRGVDIGVGRPLSHRLERGDGAAELLA